MIDERNFESNMEIQNKLILKTLINYFGEENTDIITQRFNNISLNLYLDVDKVDTYKNDYKTVCKYNISKKILDKLGIDTTTYTLKGEYEKYGYTLDSDIKLLIYHLFNENFLIGNNNNFSKTTYDCLAFLQNKFNQIDVYSDLDKQLKDKEINNYYDMINELLKQGLKEYNSNKQIKFDNLFGLLNNKPLYKFRPIYNEPNVQLDMFLNNREEICTTSNGVSNIIMDVLTLNDITLTHELLHAISLHEDINYDSINYTTGFNTLLNGKIFNEVITQRLARDISKNLNQNDISFTDSMIKGTYFKCEYERYFVLIEPFFNRYKELIKYSYLTGQPDIFEIVGEDNIKDLADIVMKAYIEKNTDKYEEESNQIFDNMIKYKSRTK